MVKFLYLVCALFAGTYAVTLSRAQETNCTIDRTNSSGFFYIPNDKLETLLQLQEDIMGRCEDTGVSNTVDMCRRNDNGCPTRCWTDHDCNRIPQNIISVECACDRQNCENIYYVFPVLIRVQKSDVFTMYTMSTQNVTVDCVPVESEPIRRPGDVITETSRIP